MYVYIYIYILYIYQEVYLPALCIELWKQQAGRNQCMLPGIEILYLQQIQLII